MPPATPLPPFNDNGDLPPGIHQATVTDIANRFGVGSNVRRRAMARLRHLLELAGRTGKLSRVFIFGSFVSAVESPRDVDLILVMQADFKLEEAPRECQTLFSHADADARFGASIFWFREGMLPQVVLEEFFDTWQTKRDGTKRGIIEVTQ
jgi:Family of unknown function (DUF6932)